jgi:hypothetical protein
MLNDITSKSYESEGIMRALVLWVNFVMASNQWKDAAKTLFASKVELAASPHGANVAERGQGGLRSIAVVDWTIWHSTGSI